MPTREMETGGRRRGTQRRRRPHQKYCLRAKIFIIPLNFLFSICASFFFFSGSLLIGAALEGQRGAQPGQQITHSAAVVRSCQPLNAR